MISGITSDKLDLVRTYDNLNPFQIGVNGVTSISYNPVTLTAITSVSYTIGDIHYRTFDLNNQNLLTTRSKVTTFKTNVSGYDFEPYITPPNLQNTFDIKEESKMNMVFPPKVKNELFIERMGLAVFERHSRLSKIKSIGELIDYRNGYYNIIENN